MVEERKGDLTEKEGSKAKTTYWSLLGVCVCVCLSECRKGRGEGLLSSIGRKKRRLMVVLVLTPGGKSWIAAELGEEVSSLSLSLSFFAVRFFH